MELADKSFFEALQKSIKTPFSTPRPKIAYATLNLQSSSPPSPWCSSSTCGVLWSSVSSTSRLAACHTFSQLSMACEYRLLTAIRQSPDRDSSLQQTGLAFLGIGFGQVAAVCCQPFFNRYVPALRRAQCSADGEYSQYRRLVKEYDHKVPPEARLIPGFYGAVFAPLGLLLFGLTSFENVPWIIPILGSSFFGVGMVFAYTSTFTYLVE